jgi:hypothetical protein
MNDNWTKRKASKVYHCRKCRKKIEIGEECYTFFHIHATHDIVECIECRETKVKEELETLSIECFQKLFNLGLKAHVPDNLTIVDYWDIKNLQTKLKEALKKQELADPLIKEEIQNLQKQFQDIENKVPQRIKLKSNRPRDGRGREYNNCSHKNIYWKLDEIAYCLDCGEDETDVFISLLCSRLQKNLNSWIDKHNLNSRETLKITSKFYQVFTTQDQLKHTYQEVVNELNQLAKSKGIDDPIEIPNNPDPERERERESKTITELNQF